MKKRNYSKFYALIKTMPGANKDDLVHTFTGGRTTRLHEMKDSEYEEMMKKIEAHADSSFSKVELRKARSAALLRIARLGINTIDNWDGINAFCLSPKIAGKEFGNLSVSELINLRKKLEMIIRKGGLSEQIEEHNPEQPDEQRENMVHLVIKNSNRYYS